MNGIKREWMWWVQPGHKIIGGVLTPGKGIEGVKWYVPTGRVAEEFAQVRDNRSLVRFADAYGLLGYYTLVPREKKPVGDPVNNWALVHAGRIRCALEVFELLREKDFAIVERELPSILKRVGFDLFPTITKALRSSTGPVSAQSQKKWMASVDWPKDPIHVACDALASLLNPRLQRVGHEIVIRADRPPGVYPTFVNLLDFIYWQVAVGLDLPQPRVCRVCKNEFFPVRRGDATLCSTKCKQKAYRDRRKERP